MTSRSGWLAAVPRLLLGAVFVLSGALGLLHLGPEPVPPNEAAAAFVAALRGSGYLWQLVKATELVGGLLVLSGVAVPLGLVLLAPVLVNIVAFGVFLAPPALPLGLVLAAAALHVAWTRRERFASLWR